MDLWVLTVRLRHLCQGGKEKLSWSSVEWTARPQQTARRKGQPKATLWVVAFQQEIRVGCSLTIEERRAAGCIRASGWPYGTAELESARLHGLPESNDTVCTRAKALESPGLGSARRYTDTGDGKFQKSLAMIFWYEFSNSAGFVNKHIRWGLPQWQTSLP